jgi:hypothetical protein
VKVIASFADAFIVFELSVAVTSYVPVLWARTTYGIVTDPPGCGGDVTIVQSVPLRVSALI